LNVLTHPPVSGSTHARHSASARGTRWWLFQSSVRSDSDADAQLAATDAAASPPVPSKPAGRGHAAAPSAAVLCSMCRRAVAAVGDDAASVIPTPPATPRTRSARSQSPQQPRQQQQRASDGSTGRDDKRVAELQAALAEAHEAHARHERLLQEQINAVRAGLLKEMVALRSEVLPSARPPLRLLSLMLVAAERCVGSRAPARAAPAKLCGCCGDAGGRTAGAAAGAATRGASDRRR
jgi:hypothetical protein